MTERFGLTQADIKAVLARVGQDVTPGTKGMVLSRPEGPTSTLVTLDRVVKGVTPEYCVHGYAECVNCYELCWLGSETHALVVGGRAYPLCMVCAPSVLAADARVERAHVNDHLRADGPH